MRATKINSVHGFQTFMVCVVLLCAFTSTLKTVVAQQQQFADLGDFKLYNSEVIRNCRIGYRTFGKLNDSESNAIVIPTWASGTTEQLASNIGTGRLLDSNKYFVVAIDALSNGVSSSPSNSQLQSRMKFPRFALRDTVATQHQLLTRKLGLSHVKAVVGVSMGGMQVFQWMISYPDFMDIAIPIVGSPRLAPYDLLLWQAQIDAIMSDRDWNNGNYSTNPAKVVEFAFGELLLTTPDNYNKSKTRQQVFDSLERAKQQPMIDANDKIRQAQAMMALDISETFDGSLEKAARAVKAKTLIIVARLDHVVTPGPALEIARLLGARLVELEGDCGHLATACEAAKVNSAVSEFLDAN